MRVLLVPAKIDTSRFIPLGVAYLAAYLEERGHKVAVYDEIPNMKTSFENAVKEFNPEIVGISCMTSTYTKAMDFAKRTKSINKNLPIVFGGIHPTAVPDQTLKEDFVDYVVVGEGELTLTDLVEYLEAGKKEFAKIDGLGYKKNGKITINKRRPLIKDIDMLPFPARHLFSMDYYAQRWNWPRGNWLKTANLMSSRGCPYNCTYCASKVMFGRTFRAMSPKRTVDEVEFLVREYGFECVSFSDDTFAIDKKRAIKIAREIKRRKLGISYRVQLRANTSDEDLIKELADSNCIQVDVGVESGSPKILKTLNKGITVEQVEKAFANYRKYGLQSGATFIIGTPGETEEDIEMSRKLAKKINANYTQFFILTPYPGTPLYEYAKEHGLFLGSCCFDHFQHGGKELNPMLKVDIPPTRLVQLRNQLNEEFVDKTVAHYLENNTFVGDLLKMFQEDPEKLRTYSKVLTETGNIGRALKSVMPHHL